MSVVKGLDALMKKLGAVNKITVEGTEKEIKRKTNSIKRDAKTHAPSESGGLRNSIKSEVITKNNTISGRVYTHNDHAMYVEFGTGPVGEASPKEVPDGVSIQYRDKGWLIPVRYFPSYTKYGLTPFEINGELFVPTKGQKAQQFMTPAARMNRAGVGKDIGSTVSHKLRKELKK